MSRFPFGVGMNLFTLFGGATVILLVLFIVNDNTTPLVIAFITAAATGAMYGLRRGRVFMEEYNDEN